MRRVILTKHLHFWPNQINLQTVDSHGMWTTVTDNIWWAGLYQLDKIDKTMSSCYLETPREWKLFMYQQSILGLTSSQEATHKLMLFKLSVNYRQLAEKSPSWSMKYITALF